jgi:hypothetical protein
LKEEIMKMHFAVGAFLLVAGFSLAAKLDIVGLREKAVSVSIYLDKPPNQGKTELWENEKISKIVPISEISRLILINGETSAPAEIDSINILRILNSDASFQNETEKAPTTHNIYEAVLVMKNGSHFLITIAGDTGRLTSEAGHGDFKVQYAPSNQDLKRTR